jgi:hypothetical protein
MSWKIYTELNGEDNPLIEDYYGNLRIFESFCEKHGVQMSHLKKTCPNPHSGEPHYGHRIWGMIIDSESKICLFATKHEFEVMKTVDSEKLEVELSELIKTDPFHRFRGKVAGKRYGL